MTYSIGITLIFLFYSLIWIQLPGMLLSQWMLPRRLNVATRLLAGYFLGFIYIATVYFIQSLFRLNGLVLIMGILASIGYVTVYIKRGRPSIFNAGEKLSPTFIIIFVFLYIVSIINFQFKFLGSLSGVSTQVYHDFLFHTGNIVSLSRSFPAMDIRVDGLTFYYHYFYDLVFAICKNIFGMDAYRLYLNGNALVCAWPLSLALMIIGERIRAGRECKEKKYFFYCFGTLVSLVAILPLNVVGGRFPISWLNNHLFGNGNAMGLSLAVMVVTIEIIVEVWYDKFSLLVLIALYLLSAAATGFKATTGAMIAAITFFVFVVELIITKRFHFHRLLYIISTILGFIFTNMIVTVGLSSSGSNNRSMILSPEGTISESRVAQVLGKLGIDAMSFPWIIPVIILCVCCIIGPTILPFAGFTYSKFKTLIKDGVIGNIYDWFVIGLVLMGVIGFSFVTIPGFSQVYFVITTAGFIFYGSVTYIIDNRGRWIAHFMNVVWGLGFIVLAVDIAHFCVDDIKQNAVFEIEAHDRADLVSKETMDAYLWLRDNTPEDSIIAVDRFSEELDYRNIYFYASAFSERQCYLEGYDYSDVDEKQIQGMLSLNERFYGDDWQAVDAAMDLCGIDYLVVTELGHPSYTTQNWSLKLVFENEDVKIYQYNKL